MPAVSGGSVGREYFELKLKLNGASAPTVLSGAGFLATSGAVAHTGGTNVVTVKMRDPWLEAIYIAAEPRDDSANGSYCTVGSITNENSQTAPATPLQFNVMTWNAGGTALNNSTLVIGIVLCLRNSSVTYGN
jgi:hypothetical protein